MGIYIDDCPLCYNPLEFQTMQRCYECGEIVCWNCFNEDFNMCNECKELNNAK